MYVKYEYNVRSWSLVIPETESATVWHEPFTPGAPLV
jgi:hypothetical protein